MFPVFPNTKTRHTFALLFTFAIVSLGWVGASYADSPADICVPAPRCSVRLLDSASPGCVDLINHSANEGDIDVCPWGFYVRNNCEQDVEFSELDCGEDCLAVQTITAGAEGLVTVRQPERGGILAQSFGLALGEETSVIDLEADHNDEVDRCDEVDEGLGCQSAPTSPTNSPPYWVFIVLVVLAARWNQMRVERLANEA